MKLSRLLAAACLLLAASVGAAQEKPDPTAFKASEWMKAKLEMSQAMLDGLTNGDFEKLETNAQKMNVINFLEKLVASDKPHYKEYMRQLNAFETANRDLLRMSSAKNLEGSTLAYMQLTVSCVNCHKIVRDAKRK